MPQTIKSMTVSNFKGIRGEVTLQPGGERLIILAGPNASGKSSFIDGIAELFDPKGVKLTKNPINSDTGATEAFAEIITDKARIRRTWKGDDAGKLTAWKIDADGDELKPGETPREFVLKQTGGAIFDATSLIDLPEPHQRAELLKLVDLPFSLEELKAKRDVAYENRKNAKRDLTELQGQVAGMPPIDPSLPAEEKPSSTILAQLDEVRAHNLSVGRAEDEAEESQMKRNLLHDETDALYRKFEESKAAYEAADTAAQKATHAAQGLERKDEENLKAQLGMADEINAKIRAQGTRRDAEARLAAKVAEHESFEAAIKAIDKQKADGLAAAKFPLPGLSVDDDGITLNGTPFVQLNSAIKRLVAFTLATIRQPDIRLFYIKDGDLFDAKSVELIMERAIEKDYYLILERNQRDAGKISAIFSEGQIASTTDGEAA